MPQSPNPEGKRWNRHSYASPRAPPDTLDATMHPLAWESEADLMIEGNLSTEVSMVVLDTLAIIEQVSLSSDFYYLENY